MTNHSYEVEVKCLIGGKEEANELMRKMQAFDPNLERLGLNKQLNHYFVGGDLHRFFANVQGFMADDKRSQLEELAKEAKDYSLRTRQANDKIILVLKISVDEGTSANTVSRIEFEAETPNLTLEELDNLALKSGFEYQAKWSRERSEYKYLGANVTIDKNAGYGYLAEFEKVINDEAKVAEVKSQLRELIAKLNLEELLQDRLERMFAFYNANWQDYYGTDKVFVVR